MKHMKVKLTLQEEILGMSPANPEIYTDYIGSKHPNAQDVAEEVAAIGIEETVERGTTVFPRNADGVPIMWDYQIRGFFKDACGMLSRVAGKDPETGKKKKAINESGKLTAYKKVIDGLIFVFPRKIPIIFDGQMGMCQRPIRVQNNQGEMVALASSESIPAGATMEFVIKMFSDEHVAVVKEWLDYGEFRGLGQWRNSGKGTFTYEILQEW